MRANGIRIVVLGLCLLVIAARADVHMPFMSPAWCPIRAIPGCSSVSSHGCRRTVAIACTCTSSPVTMPFPMPCGASRRPWAGPDGQQLVAVPLFQGQPRYHSVILTSRDRQADDLTDFADAVFAYSDPRSNSGFLVPAWYLRRKEQNIHTFFRLLLHAGSHERSIQAVSAGLADVAAVDEYVWVLFKRDHPEPAAGLREVMKLGPYPFTPIVAGRQVPAARIRALQATLAAMSADPQGRAILADLSLDGFVIRDPAFYEPLARMLDETAQDGH